MSEIKSVKDSKEAKTILERKDGTVVKLPNGGLEAQLGDFFIRLEGKDWEGQVTKPSENSYAEGGVIQIMKGSAEKMKDGTATSVMFTEDGQILGSNYYNCASMVQIKNAIVDAMKNGKLEPKEVSNLENLVANIPKKNGYSKCGPQRQS